MATITVPDESRRKQVVVGSSAQTSFTFDWVIFDTATDIRVWNGATELVNGTTFSVAGNSGTDGGFDGGTVTLIGTLASGVSNTTVTIEGSTPNNRLSNLAATGPLDIDLLNKDLNRVITMIHQSIDTIKKSPRLADDTTLSLPITFPAPSASKVISWNSSANALEATVTTGDITNAATKATEAAASATAAASSATSAASSATTATTQAGIATTKAAEAAASAASAAVTIASQAEAEAGSNNANVMTPLRTKQAVDSYGVITADDVATSGANKILKLDSSGDLPALSGANLTSLNASNLGSGTVPTARLGTGSASGSVFLAGDNTWKAVTAGDGPDGHSDEDGEPDTITTFTSSGTWTVPASASKILIELWGGGGSGGMGTSGSESGGGGGGGYDFSYHVLADFGSTETVTIGAGGAAKTSNGDNGDVGGTTSVTVTNMRTLYAYGGGGGAGSNLGAGGGGGGGGEQGGAGSTATGRTASGAGGGPNGGAALSSAGHGNDSHHGGGSGGCFNLGRGGNSIFGGGGGAQSVGGNSIYGGGGGSGRYLQGGMSVYGGNGGYGSGSGQGQDGKLPGGGGGGGVATSSGAGGNGYVRISIWN